MQKPSDDEITAAGNRLSADVILCFLLAREATRASTDLSAIREALAADIAAKCDAMADTTSAAGKIAAVAINHLDGLFAQAADIHRAMPDR